MSNGLFHASLSFSASAMLLHLWNLPVQYAFAASLLSIAMDLDRTISPTRRHERFMHSTWALLGSIVLAFVLVILTVPLPMSAIPSISIATHLLQDALHAEQTFTGPLLQRLDPNRTFRPVLARTLDVLSIPLGALMAVL